MSAPYYYESVDMLVKLKVPAIKIGSGEITKANAAPTIRKTKPTVLVLLLP
jgi:sialic acid synthase SpsE